MLAPEATYSTCLSKHSREGKHAPEKICSQRRNMLNGEETRLAEKKNAQHRRQMLSLAEKIKQPAEQQCAYYRSIVLVEHPIKISLLLFPVLLWYPRVLVCLDSNIDIYSVWTKVQTKNKAPITHSHAVAVYHSVKSDDWPLKSNHHIYPSLMRPNTHRLDFCRTVQDELRPRNRGTHFDLNPSEQVESVFYSSFCSFYRRLSNRIHSF